jgi:hypothetical protein
MEEDLKKHRLVMTPVIASLAFTPAVIMITASPSNAATVARKCAFPNGDVAWVFGKASWTWKASSIKSNWLTGPGTITYTKTKTATVSGSVTGTLSTEASAIFAKASASVAVTVGGGWTWTDSWSYAISVPKGKTQRLHMYHLMKKFSVTKRKYRCSDNLYHYAGSGIAYGAPKGAKYNDDNVWRAENL